MSDLKIFTDNIEQEAINQINTLVSQPCFSDCKVRIMPDVHAGVGCVIGFTANLGDKVIPNIVGVDTGCGMRVVALNNKDIDFKLVDEKIRKYVPNGRNVHEGRLTKFQDLKDLYCYRELRDTKRIERSLGTLGGGNHFIEIDRDDDGRLYLVIHSGSRNLGKQVAEHYQNMAIDLMQGKDVLFKKQKQIIDEYKATGRKNEIQSAIKELHRAFKIKMLDIPKELCYLTGEYRDMYLHDMKICQAYAVKNREIISDIIIKNCGLSLSYDFETIHNYIDHDSNIVRKGAVSARKDEMLLIPINMKDGCILGKEKGNSDWNQSAPHGAGRIMSRAKARELVNINEYEKSMVGVYTTSVNVSTIDEAPMVYKTMSEIVANIKDTVDVIKIIKPVYNFKACE